MSLQLKLQTYRGILRNLGSAVATTAGVLLWTTDSSELYMADGTSFQRLSANNKLYTAATLGDLRTTVVAAGGNAILGDLVSVNAQDTYLLVGYASTTWQVSHTYVLGDSIIDTIGNLQTVTSIGSAPHHSGGTEPSWATSGTTADGDITWTKGSGFVLIGHTGSGAGTVTSVNSVSPDGGGNVTLTIDDIPNGTTYGRILVAAITSGEFDLAKSHKYGFTNDNLIQPSALGTWSIGATKTLGQVIVDPTNAGKVQQVIIAGTAGGSQPTFSNTVGGTTTDGSITWENIGTSLRVSVKWAASATSNQFVTYIDNDGVQHMAQASLAGLSDATITTPAQENLLKYDSGTSKWINSNTIDCGTF